MLYPTELRGHASHKVAERYSTFRVGRPAALPGGGKEPGAGAPRTAMKGDKDMKLGGEPRNWIGLGLILFLIAAISLSLHWLNVPKPPV